MPAATPSQGHPPVQVLTVTLHPSIDLLFETDRFVAGEVARAKGGARALAGGKGINVSETLTALGVGNAALVLCPEEDLALYERRIVSGRRLDRFTAVAIPGTLRQTVEVSVSGTGGEAAKLWKINGSGAVDPLADGRDGCSRMQEAITRAGLQAGGWVVLTGSLPAGIAPTAYGELTRRCRELGFRVLVDTEGPALEHAISAGLELVKPNRGELLRTLGLGETQGARAATSDLVRDAGWLRRVDGEESGAAGGARLVVVTDEGRPLWVGAAGGKAWRAGFRQALYPTRTGAGDVFTGYLLDGLLRWPAALEADDAGVCQVLGHAMAGAEAFCAAGKPLGAPGQFGSPSTENVVVENL